MYQIIYQLHKSSNVKSFDIKKFIIEEGLEILQVKANIVDGSDI